jgi:acetylornithine deacetylase/succinyl-diaminopimelate desuccinylase-like protein
VASVRRFADRSRGPYESWLERFVECPSVSADPVRALDIRRMAGQAVESIRELGGRAELIETKGNPLVFGTMTHGSGAPPVAFYNHLDVQPASRDEEGWRSEPFTLTRRDERWFGRGATDDKGPALCALFGAAAAREAGVPFDVRCLWELEEEIGSPHFEEALVSLGGRAACSSVVVSDTSWLSSDRPASECAFRGYQGFTLRLRTAGGDRHSGEVGGAARNPVGELAGLLAAMHDARTGHVTIPGFYDDVDSPSPGEVRDFLASGFSLEEFRRVHDLRSLRTADAEAAMRRIWAEPTLEVHGIAGGYTGPGVKSIVPGSAEAKMSCRLVPRQDPRRIAELVISFARARVPDLEIETTAGALPYQGVTSGPHAEALKEAYRFAFGTPPVFVRSGGSIGAVSTMDRLLRCPILFLGLSLPEHGYHAANENFDWAQAREGIAAFARLLELLGKTE